MAKPINQEEARRELLYYAELDAKFVLKTTVREFQSAIDIKDDANMQHIARLSSIEVALANRHETDKNKILEMTQKRGDEMLDEYLDKGTTMAFKLDGDSVGIFCTNTREVYCIKGKVEKENKIGVGWAVLNTSHLLSFLERQEGREDKEMMLYFCSKNAPYVLLQIDNGFKDDEFMLLTSVKAVDELAWLASNDISV